MEDVRTNGRTASEFDSLFHKGEFWTMLDNDTLENASLPRSPSFFRKKTIGFLGKAGTMLDILDTFRQKSNANDCSRFPPVV